MMLFSFRVFFMEDKMKKILVLGLGAQGSAAALRLDLDPAVSEIVCADYDIKAVNNVVSKMTKGTGVRVDASDVDSIISAARGADLILNALSLKYTQNVLDAALAVQANYQDYNGTDKMYQLWRDSGLSEEFETPYFSSPETLRWWESYMAMFKIYEPRFRDIRRLAMFGTGSAPGLICAATKYSMRYLDSCDTIYNFVWEGVYAKRFQPFWWSPITALTDMSDPAVALENGDIIDTKPFGNPVKRQYSYMDEPVTFREHCHDEPFMYAFSSEKHLKGVKNAYFKYAGAGMDFAEKLYEAGMLSHEEEDFNGQKIVPFEFVLNHIPEAPKYREDIKSFIDEGLALDSGCMVVESYGKKEGKEVLVEVHVSAPGFKDSFDRAGITSEMYLTGQSGYLFSRLFIEDKLTQFGLISPEMLTDEQIDQFFEYASELDINIDTVIK